MKVIIFSHDLRNCLNIELIFLIITKIIHLQYILHMYFRIKQSLLLQYLSNETDNRFRMISFHFEFVYRSFNGCRDILKYPLNYFGT